MDIENAIKTITSWYEIENDGIGAYEYWGQKCFDTKPDYVTGGVEFYFEFGDVKFIKQIFEEDENFEDEIINEFYDNAYGEDIEIEDINFIDKKGVSCIQIIYVANVPRD